MDYLTTHTSLSPIRRGFAPGFINYKKGYTLLAAASDKAYQLLAHGRWFSPGTPASFTTKTGRHDIAEILLKVALSAINQIKYNNVIGQSERFPALHSMQTIQPPSGLVYIRTWCGTDKTSAFLYISLLRNTQASMQWQFIICKWWCI